MSVISPLSSSWQNVRLVFNSSLRYYTTARAVMSGFIWCELRQIQMQSLMEQQGHIWGRDRPLLSVKYYLVRYDCIYVT